jgi:MYXO-CTERM domain-containing protein
MAGARVTFNFGGEGYDTQTISGTFDPRSPGDGLISSADVSTPEPASVATFGAGLGILLALAARRRRDNHSPIVMVPICTVRQQSEPRQ